MLRALDIAVVGAGTAGSAAAVLLARAGHRVTLYERVPNPGPVGAGIIMQPSGLAALAALAPARRDRSAARRAQGARLSLGRVVVRRPRSRASLRPRALPGRRRRAAHDWPAADGPRPHGRRAARLALLQHPRRSRVRVAP